MLLVTLESTSLFAKYIIKLIRIINEATIGRSNTHEEIS